jgi:hypothetical protein
MAVFRAIIKHVEHLPQQVTAKLRNFNELYSAVSENNHADKRTAKHDVSLREELRAHKKQKI